MSFLCPCLQMCYLRREFEEQFADFNGADKIYIGDTGAFCFDNISTSVLRM